MNVFFTGGGTGGHLYPALAIARALVQLRPDVVPHFIGAQRGIERELLPKSEFGHTLLDLHPVYRSAPWKNALTLTSLVGGWRAVRQLAQRHSPRLVVATGGYASGATLCYAAGARIPYVIQEQNSHPGMTVRLFSHWAREIHLGFPEAAALLPKRAAARSVDTGNPIAAVPRGAIDRAAARRAMGLEDRLRLVVLAFGGSQGSAALNALVQRWVNGGLPADVGLIWATGRAHFAKHAAGAEDGRIVVRPYLDPIADAYAATDAAIARAGAMTTAELCAWGIPMFLIPLPTAAGDHQTENARALGVAGAAEWAPERDATPETLDAFVGRLLSGTDDAELAQRRARALARARPNAAAVIAKRLDTLLRAGT